jgi:hypothetical protein
MIRLRFGWRVFDSGPVTRKKKTTDIEAPPVSDQERGGEARLPAWASLG